MVTSVLEDPLFVWSFNIVLWLNAPFYHGALKSAGEGDARYCVGAAAAQAGLCALDAAVGEWPLLGVSAVWIVYWLLLARESRPPVKG